MDDQNKNLTSKDSPNISDNIINNLNRKKIDIDNNTECYVIHILESVIKVSYIANAQVHWVVQNEAQEIIGFVYNINEIDIDIVLVIGSENIIIRQKLYITSSVIKFSFSDNMLGTVVDPLGNMLTTFTAKEDYIPNRSTPIFIEAAPLANRSEIDEQLVTGNNFIDFARPIGFGQRMLLIGDSKAGKTTTITNIIKNLIANRAVAGLDQKTICIYVSIGKNNVDIARLTDTLVSNAISNVLVIATSSADPLGLQYIAPFAAMSVANFYAKSKYKLVVYIDDLTTHATLSRAITLLLKNKVGRECYGADIFYIHAALLECACKLKDGGSVTCLPVVETIDEDIARYIPTNVISITDGQLWHSIKMLHNNVVPPIEYGLSVSRLGNKMSYDIFKPTMSIINKGLAMYYANLDLFAMYGSDLDESILDSIKNGLYIIDLIYKTNAKPLNILMQIIYCMMLVKKYKYRQYSIQDIKGGKFLLFITDKMNAIYKHITNNIKLADLFKNNVEDPQVIDYITTALK